MNQRKSVVIFSVAIAMGLVAVALALYWTNKKISGSFVQTVVAARDIAAGEKLGVDNIQLVEWPRSSSIRGSSSSVQVFDGRVTSQPFTAGEPILDQRLAPNGSRAGLNSIITPGRRAMTVKVNEVVGVAGFALPGNFVDILVTVTHNRNPPISKIVLERIPVLAVAQDHSVKDETKPKVVSAVTLEVTPSQAERLDLARSVGNLTMVLRNQTDDGSVTSRGALIADILQGSSAPNTRQSTATPSSGVPQIAPIKIEIIRGVNRSMVSPG